MFTIQRDALNVLLRQRYSETLKKSDWALPGGYIRPTESLADSAVRTLAHQTGIGDVYLEQLYTFGRPDRHPKSRVITVAYLALIPVDHAEDIVDSPNIRWHDVADLPGLYLDHEDIIKLARDRLVSKLAYSTIALQLAPALFTLSELQQIYEAILAESLDKRNFRKRILALDCVEQTSQQRANRSHRPARLYRYTKANKLHYLK